MLQCGGNNVPKRPLHGERLLEHQPKVLNGVVGTRSGVTNSQHGGGVHH
jgi:hypothetical protein